MLRKKEDPHSWKKKELETPNFHQIPHLSYPECHSWLANSGPLGSCCKLQRSTRWAPSTTVHVFSPGASNGLERHGDTRDAWWTCVIRDDTCRKVQNGRNLLSIGFFLLVQKAHNLFSNLLPSGTENVWTGKPWACYLGFDSIFLVACYEVATFFWDCPSAGSVKFPMLIDDASHGKWVKANKDLQFVWNFSYLCIIYRRHRQSLVASISWNHQCIEAPSKWSPPGEGQSSPEMGEWRRRNGAPARNGVPQIKTDSDFVLKAIVLSDSPHSRRPPISKEIQPNTEGEWNFPTGIHVETLCGDIQPTSTNNFMFWKSSLLSLLHHPSEGHLQRTGRPCLLKMVMCHLQRSRKYRIPMDTPQWHVLRPPFLYWNWMEIVKDNKFIMFLVV